MTHSHLRKQPNCIQNLVHNLHHVVGGFWDWNRLFRDPEHERQHLAMLLGFLVAVAAPWFKGKITGKSHRNHGKIDGFWLRFSLQLIFGDFGDGDLGTDLDFDMILGDWSRFVKITSASKSRNLARPERKFGRGLGLV